MLKELHAAICRDQLTYDARNDLGQRLQIPLPRGEWKTQPNHVHRPDGTLLEYTPPEHVQAEIERLVAYYREAEHAHPVVRAAWLHHRFVGVHPFADGNGRVARALTLLVLLRSHYAPLVVDRRARGDYFAALDAANDGDLRPLVRLFARLEITALRSELERPARPEAVGVGAVKVARAYVERLKELRGASDAEKESQVAAVAAELHRRIRDQLQLLAQDLKSAFSEIDRAARSAVFQGAPGETNSGWWRAQIIGAARSADFWVNLSAGTWWTQLRLKVLAQTLRFVAVVQKVGHGETGVLALTVFAEIVPSPAENDGEDHAYPQQAFEPSDADSVTFVYSDDVDARWDEVRGLLDRALSATVARFAQELG